MKFKEKMQSRKYQLVVLIIALATLGTFIPPIVNLIIGTSLKILAGSEWVAVVSMVISAYIAGNVFQNRAEINASYIEDTHTRTIVQDNMSGANANEEFENREDAEA